MAPHLDVLVTGATGFAGTNVARVLVADGYRVRVLARPASSLRALEGCGVEVVRGDTLEPDSVAAAIAGAGVPVSSVSSAHRASAHSDCPGRVGPAPRPRP